MELTIENLEKAVEQMSLEVTEKECRPKRLYCFPRGINPDEFKVTNVTNDGNLMLQRIV